jgi:flagellar M-ring protein FliF
MTDTLTPPETNASMFAFLDNMSQQQKIGAMVAVAAFIAAMVGLWMWNSAPEYRVLYSNLSDRDGGSIIESLQQQNIPYKFAEGGGALLVPADRVHETRLRLASQGLPKGGTVGFELMETQKFGTSQFLEQVNYQRALEGELSRSMETIDAVANARVHLAIPKPSVFVKDQQKPSASVILALHPGRTLDPGQVNGIVHLVSSSIPNMPALSVTILDQKGNMLSSTRDPNDQSMDATQLKYVREIEKDYIKRIEAILIPISGQQNVRAQVTADIDFSQVEQTAETYKPNQKPGTGAIRSSQTSDSQNGINNTGGVPGALTNQPPVPATAPIVKPANSPNGTPISADGSASSTHKDATTNFEVDRTIQHTKLPVGSIRRLSVAVVMNNHTVPDAKTGKPISKPYTEEEKNQMNALVKDAMGFDAKRGDTLNLLNSAFNNDEEVIPETPWWKERENIALFKTMLIWIVVLGIIGFILFGVLRPLLKVWSAKAKAEAEAIAAAAEAAAASAAAELERKRQDPHGDFMSEKEKLEQAFENNLRIAQQLSRDDPGIIASVLKDWVNGDE